MGRAKKRQLQKLSLLYVLAPLVAVGGVLQQNVMGAALDNGGGGDQRQLGLLTQLRDRQSPFFEACNPVGV